MPSLGRSAASVELPERLPEPGELVGVRSRRWLVDEVVTDPSPAVVRLACADDDAQGERLDVFWELELDREIIRDEGWDELAARGFDDPRLFAAFFNTLRWSSVTATDPNLFQSPFRAGIRIDAYQMEPLRKALRLPRVNLFIADDTGLGKTIEAGLIARELLLRKRAKTIVVAAPPSVLEQWQAELEERFGLTFELLDRHYVARVRRERGFGVNPWTTHSRFLVSHNLLVDPAYAEPMRAWIDEKRAGSLLILDEAHHAAPSSGGRYGIETKFTRTVRDIGWRFEHRLFLSATPHNGHSNSFSTLLELLDPYRFTRGVKVKGKKELEPVMVRRLKEDIRQVQGGGFPNRNVVRLEIADLPADAPELVLSRLLDEYRAARAARFAQAPVKAQAAAGLLVVGLQQRLLSSIEAFARTLAVHGRTAERADVRASESGPTRSAQADLFTRTPGADDERAGWSDEELALDEAKETEAVTSAAERALGERVGPTVGLSDRERELLEQMAEVAERHRHEPDAKTRRLIAWIREHMCPDLPDAGRGDGQPASWNERRVLIFTESREGTKRYLQQVLEEAIAGSDRADERIETITGLLAGPARQQIQRRFNTDPSEDPLRILIATDAAREGLNFQAHCADLFHFDLPWNPGRIEQRNGRIDRKLQPADEVRCHYFVLPQRAEDHVLDVLVRKTETIRRELGSLSQVIDDEIEHQLTGGIPHSQAGALAARIDEADLDAERKAVAGEELEEARERQDDLREQIDRCRNLLERSREWVGFKPEAFRDALSCSLSLLGAEPLTETHDDRGRPVWTVPPLNTRAAADPSWASTLDTLRTPRPAAQKLADWRREAPIRPVVFKDEGVVTEATVHLHLDQRLAQRLLSRFRAQGFIYDDISRACLAQVADSIPRVVLLGRLCLFGRGAERLHEVLVPVAARWQEPERRDGGLAAYARTAERRSLELLDTALADPTARVVPGDVTQHLLASAAQDVHDLLPQLEERAQELATEAQARLRERGSRESADLERVLEEHRDRVRAELEKGRLESAQLQMWPEEERRQRESDMRAWERRLQTFDRDLGTEPGRIRNFYEVRARRIEPVGLVYLWPDTN